MRTSILSILALSAAMASWASEPLTLTFQRSGTDAGSVTVASDIAGVNATLTSVSHNLKEFGNETLCADANGNTSPTIVYNFSITGLPNGWSTNQIGLDITGYNAAGNAQQQDDGKKRQFNVAVTANSSQVAAWTNLDPAAGIQGARKVWETQLNRTLKGANSIDLKITVTKGADNVGCFFGLNSICLSTNNDVVEPNNKVYTIKWKNNTSSYMTAFPDGTIQIGDYKITNRVFWEFIPTDKENCYYIRNTANGLYIGSCNMNPSSSSRIALSTEPVEYYVGLSAATSGDNKDCYWLSSTDCADYSTESSGARCLNKDGASSYVITWTTGVGNYGSYWTLTETEDLYEVRPFSTELSYYILNAEHKAYNYSDQWVNYSQADVNARWKFNGTSNAEGGFQIINASDNTPLNNGARYKVIDNTTGYSFVSAEGEYLSLAGSDVFTFIAVRNSFAMNNRIFQMPCGSIGDTWIASVSTGRFHYPMATRAANGSYVEGTVTQKPAKYVILTRDAIDAAPGTTVTLDITLNKEPSENYTLTAFADFDRDGIFEYSLPVLVARQTSADIEVPETAKCGDCRLRLRLNSNAFSGADDEVLGEILDLKMKIANPGTELIDPVVKPNDPNRGEAQWSQNIATATSKGNAMFLYWNEGLRIVSVDSQLTVEPSTTPRVLTAVFSANTDLKVDINPVIINTVNSDATVDFNGAELTVSVAESTAILLFDTKGSLVGQTTSKVLNVAALPGGVYIAKAITKSGIVSSKIVKP